MPHRSTPTAAPRYPRGVYESDAAPCGWQGYVIVNAAGNVVGRFEAIVHPEVDQIEVRTWLVEQLNQRDPLGPSPSIRLVP
jgi:hypothetical protein